MSKVPTINVPPMVTTVPGLASGLGFMFRAYGLSLIPQLAFETATVTSIIVVIIFGYSVRISISSIANAIVIFIISKSSK